MSLENQDAMILSDVNITKYYEIAFVNETSFICYEENPISCKYKSNNQYIQKVFPNHTGADIKPK